MRKLLVLWAVCTVLGGTLIALPDTGPRVLALSGEHGPGAVDAAGIGFLLLGFGLLLGWIVRRRATIAEHLWLRPKQLAALAFLAGVGAGLLVAGVFTDFWWWWLVGAVLLQVFWLSLVAAGRTN